MKYFLFVLLSPLFLWCYEYQLCLTTMFQDEAPYLVEWIEYHIERGVELFRLYNNNSKDNYKEVLKPYIDRGIVQLVEWPSVHLEYDTDHHTSIVQVGAFNDSIAYFKGKTKWLAIIDSDEFIFPVVEDNILILLEKYYPEVSGLNINWQNFGTSGIERGDKIGKNVFLLGSLVRKADVNYSRNNFCKSIVQPDYVSHCTNPHYCEFIEGHWGVNTQFKPTKGYCLPEDISKIRINHYWGRDEWFVRNVKIPRYIRWGTGEEHVRKLLSEMNDVEDRDIQKYLPLKINQK